MAKILIVDDDRALVDQLCHFLSTIERHVVEAVSDGTEALSRLNLYEYDLVILDWEMPGLNGVQVCKTFRSNRGQLPVLMLTAKTNLEDKEEGFTAGIDDYLTKPFSLKELALRIKALLRRPRQMNMGIYTVGDVCLDTSTGQVHKGGIAIQLTAREYELLELLFKNAGRYMTAEEIANKLWSSESEFSHLSVKTVVKRLRAKIQNGDEDSLIQNVPGRGYFIMQSNEQPPRTDENSIGA